MKYKCYLKTRKTMTYMYLEQSINVWNKIYKNKDLPLYLGKHHEIQNQCLLLPRLLNTPNITTVHTELIKILPKCPEKQTHKLADTIKAIHSVLEFLFTVKFSPFRQIPLRSITYKI